MLPHTAVMYGSEKGIVRTIMNNDKCRCKTIRGEPLEVRNLNGVLQPTLPVEEPSSVSVSFPRLHA